MRYDSVKVIAVNTRNSQILRIFLCCANIGVMPVKVYEPLLRLCADAVMRQLDTDLYVEETARSLGSLEQRVTKIHRRSDVLS